MALLQTPEKDKTFAALDFTLKGTDGKIYSLDDVKGEKGTVIMFICNHCPYVKGIVGRMVQDAKILQDAGIGVAAISSNDVADYPEDSFENMVLFAEKHGFTFPYLIDETQAVARHYGAVCTPDIFGFDKDGALEYRGRLDSGSHKTAPAADMTHDLRDAMLAVAAGQPAPAHQTPSMGCSIKWKETT